MIRLENTSGNHSKFYEVWHEKNPLSGQWIVKARYGRIGTNGHKPVVRSRHNDMESAERRIDSIIRGKAKKGYSTTAAGLSAPVDEVGTAANPEVLPSVPRDAVTDDGDLAYETDAGVRYAWRKFVEAADAHSAVASIDTEREGGARFAREVFGRLHDGDLIELDEEDQVPWAKWAHERAEEVHEFTALADEVRGDRWEAGYVAITVTRAVLAQMDGDDNNGTAGHGPERQDEGMVRQAIREAVRGATEKLTEEREAADLMFSGWGTGGGSEVFPGDGLTQKAALSKHIQSTPNFKRIMEIAGRMRGVADSKRKQRTRAVPEEIADVDQGADFGRTLPAELALLRQRGLRLDFFRRYVERQTLVYSLQGTEAKKRGPVVVLLDCSQSMSGERDIWSKALAIALLRVAKTEHRSFAAITYDGDWRRIYTVTRSEAASPDYVSQVVQMLNEAADGDSTDWERPIRRAWSLMMDGEPNRSDLVMSAKNSYRLAADDYRVVRAEWREFSKADLIMITDGACSVTDDFRAEWAEWRRARGVSAYGLCVGNSSGLERLGDIMDEVHSFAPSGDYGGALDSVMTGVIGETIG